jgi:phospholipid/cholesterol/gamma-HCH transport system permease protein
LLVVFSILVGWMGGALVAALNQEIGVSLQTFFSNLRDVVEFQDVVNGLIKSFVFALVIGVVSCHQGLERWRPARNRPIVTKAVVNSIVLILILDYVLTRFLLYFD